MDYNYSRYTASERERRLERFFEILPGALSWAVIIGVILFSFVKPLISAIIMIAVLLYWLLRLIYMNIFLVLSYARLEIEKDTDWMERITGIDNLGTYLKELCSLEKQPGLKNKISALLHCEQLRKLRKSGNPPPRSEDIYHLVIIPVIKEPRNIIEPGIIGIKKGEYPSKRILVIIAVEESAPQAVKEDIFKLREEHGKDFLDLIVNVHPNNVAGEARVKGANTTHAARAAAEYFKNRNIPYENIIVSCFDADTVPRENYFSCLTYHFMITPERNRASYQPIPVYHNNIWDVPSFARIIDIGTSFFQLIEATNPRKLVTFSSHSMSFKALVDVGYWPVDMVSDDSAIFWKAFIHYDGKYNVIPMYTTVSMDIVMGRRTQETIINIYKQKRRWAWGVENFPIVMRAFLTASPISVHDKISFTFKLLDSFISLATMPFLIIFVSWLPALFARRDFLSSTVYYTAPRIGGTIFGLASIGIIVCMIISLLLLPAKKTRHNLLTRLGHVFEWILIPVVVLALSAFPALDAQTRLMRGKYMEFWVTEKHRNGR